MSLSKEAEYILQNAVIVNEWPIMADTIVHAADLIRAGYLTAEGDYEPCLIPTDKGREAAVRRKLVVLKEDGGYGYPPKQ